ncbi:hypothetical protein H632_c4798p0, partial [Helicosporidium sp. ATCC 50920]
MAAGLDSLGAVELRDDLSRAAGVALPASTVLDYPSIGALSDYILELLAEEGQEAGLGSEGSEESDEWGSEDEELDQSGSESSPLSRAWNLAHSPLLASLFPSLHSGPATRKPSVLETAACRLAGAPSQEAFWRVATSMSSPHAVTPLQRWDADALLSVGAEPGRTYARPAAFAEGVEAFDGALFGMPAAECAAVDP